MSVYVRGVELPKDDHVRVLVLHPDGRVIDEWGNTYQAMPVPPHGLIAREQILDAIRLELAQANACNDMDDYDVWMRYFDYVRKFPTVIRAEEE